MNFLFNQETFFYCIKIFCWIVYRKGNRNHYFVLFCIFPLSVFFSFLSDYFSVGFEETGLWLTLIHGEIVTYVFFYIIQDLSLDHLSFRQWD